MYCPHTHSIPVRSHPIPTDPSVQLLNNLVTSWAVVQAAASLPAGSLASITAAPAPTGTAASANLGRKSQQMFRITTITRVGTYEGRLLKAAQGLEMQICLNGTESS